MPRLTSHAAVVARLAVGAILTCITSPAAAQHHVTGGLPHNIPDLCQTDANRTVVAAGDTRTLTGSHSCVEVHGSATISGQLIVTTILVYPGGDLVFADGSETIWRSAPIDTSADPEQWGHGLVVVDGRVRAAGQVKTAYARLAVEPAAGATTLTLAAAPTGWQVGDRIVLPDSRHLRAQDGGTSYVPQWEERTVAAVNGTTVSLSAALTFAHPGGRSATGVLEFLPHVANLTRSIRIRSELAAGVRGHMAFLGRTDVDLRSVELRDLGRTTAAALHCTLRATGSYQSATTCTPGTGAIVQIGTNQIGRYPLHFHHLDGPAGLPATTPQFTAEGLAIVSSRKWPVAIHNSHYGRVAQNVVWGYEGAGIVTEDGSETENVIEGNWVFRSERNEGGRDNGGREGVGFYLRGPLNRVRGNVAGNTMPSCWGINLCNSDAAYGFKYFLGLVNGGSWLGNISIPTGKGETTRVTVESYTLPITEFDGNECYGAMESCLTYWSIGSVGSGPTRTTQVSTIRNLRSWHHYNNAIFAYESAFVTIDGLVTRGQTNYAVGYYAGDYKSDAAVIRNGDIQGMSVGIVPSGNPQGPPADNPQRRPVLIENNVMRNAVDVSIRTMFFAAADAGFIQPREVILRANQLAGSVQIQLVYHDMPTRNLVISDVIRYEDPSGASRIYYAQQAPGFVVPQSVLPGLIGAPVAGLTNQQTWNSYGIAIAGAVAPCSTTYPGIVGAFVCGSATPPPPPPPDSDGDGVADSADLCPGTAPGTPVDPSGCPLSAPPPPDSDGDGVPDSIDVCPGTPPGTAVDAVGCPVVIGTPPSGNLITNGDFAASAAGWQVYATPSLDHIVWNVTGGVFQYYRVPPSPSAPNQAVLLQDTRVPLAADTPLSVTVRFGNSSTVRKRISILVHDANFADLAVCTFWLAPGAPLRSYGMRMRTTQTWSAAVISFYAATAGSDGGYYQVDDVSLAHAPGQSIDRTDCIDPTAPAATSGTSTANLLINAGFGAGSLPPWQIYGEIDTQIVSDALRFRRRAVGVAGVVFQSTGRSLAAGELLTVNFSLGNLTSARRRVTVVVHDLNFTDLTACTFWLAPGQPLAAYAMRTFASRPWTNATVSIYPATVDPVGWLLLDTVNVRLTPSATIVGTECIEPAPVPDPATTVTSSSVSAFTSAARASRADRPPAAKPAAVDSALDLGASGGGTVWREAVFDLRGATEAWLTVESWLTAAGVGAEIQSTTDGVHWETLALVPASTGWQALSIDLSAFAGATVRLRFVGYALDASIPMEWDAWRLGTVRLDWSKH